MARKYHDVVVENRELNQLVEIVKAENNNIAIDELDNVTKRFKASYAQRVKFAMKMLARGDTNDIIVEELCKKYDIKTRQAYTYINRANFKLHEEFEKYSNEIGYANVCALKEIVRDSMENGDRRSAIAAIAELNRMAGLVTGTTVKTDGKEVEITFNS